jgi:glycosyltransferase involved in cell wall biosynthesis
MSSSATAAALRCAAPNRRILLLTTSLDFGGAETVLVQLARHLARRAWDVGVLSLLPVRAFRQELEDAGVPVSSLNLRPGWGGPASLWKLVSEVRAFHPAILHAHLFHANIAARLAKPLLGCKVICTIHSTTEAGIRGQNARLREFAYRLTNWLADGNTAVSQAVCDRYERDRIIRRRTLQVVANGVDLDRFRRNPEERRQVRAALGWQGRFVWLAVGRLVPAKNYPLLLAAFRQLRGLFPAAKLAVAGDGPLRAELQSLAAASALERDVDFLGTRADVPALLNGCDAFVLASDHEGSSVALLEAGAAAKVAVATSVDAASEAIQHHHTGFLCPPRNLDALVGAMRAVMDLSAEQRETMGRLARAHIERHFALDHTLGGYERLYSQLLEPQVRHA